MTERYQIISLIKKDQLSAIYLAQDTTLQRKVIYRIFDSDKLDPSLEGFSHYTGKLCALQHPSLLTIYDIIKYEKGYCMVTQVLEAESLEERLKKGALSQADVYNMASDLLDALHTTHSVNLYHGAMRTDSVKRVPHIRGGYRYIWVDFGLDRILSMIFGAPVFMADPVLMAPELIEGLTFPNQSTDLFTLGQLCYTSLVGGHPYANKTPPERVYAFRNGGLPHLSTYTQGIQEDFANWVMWLVQGNPNNRPQSVQEAMIALQTIILKTPTSNITEKPQPPQESAFSGGMVSDLSISVPYAQIAATKPMKHGQTLIADRPTKAIQLYKLQEQPVERGRHFRFIALGVTVILLTVLVTVFLMRHDFFIKQENETKNLKLPAAQIVHLEQNSLHVVPIKDGISPNVTFDIQQLKDWTIVTEAPASRSKIVENGGGKYIKNILAIGGFKEFTAPKKKVIFQTKKFYITSNIAVTNASKGKAKKGEGWDIIIKVPQCKKGQNTPLKVTLLMFQKLCDFEIFVKIPQSNDDNITHLSVPETSPGMVSIPMVIKKPRSGYYSFKILASPTNPQADFEIGLGAIFIE